MEIKRIAVLGAGAMGHGIAQLAAMAGFDVNLRDISEEFLANGMKNIRWSIGKLIEKGRISPAEADKTLKRIRTVVPLKEAVEDVDFVIEAIPEILKLKQEVFKEIDGYAPAHAILASNTSVLSISDMAAATNRPQKVIGMHFFNPAQLMRLVEVIMGQKTDSDTRDVTMDLAKKIGKEPVLCKKMFQVS